MHSKIIVLPDREAIARFANEYAPEHLIISMQEPWAMAEKIYAAGSIFIGNYSPESAGDYASGTNHTLPTSRWARSCSALVKSCRRKVWRALAVPLRPWLLRRDWTLMQLR